MGEKNNRFYEYENSVKFRLNYPSGASECAKKCRCILCKRKRGEETYHEEVDKPEGQ